MRPQPARGSSPRRTRRRLQIQLKRKAIRAGVTGLRVPDGKQVRDLVETYGRTEAVRRACAGGLSQRD